MLDRGNSSQSGDAPFVSALAHPNRVGVLRELRLNGNLSCAEIAAHMGETPGRVRGHLRALEQVGLVRRAGGTTRFVAEPDPLLDWLSSLRELACAG
ncbi:helix-turn-helix domain-containing protein (plasmid) [Rathayibacter sp. VKM Ac-2759]|nr:helix-turn-helix domain-containing protein [Rathayibacter sp. VKM Ac-2759]